MMDSFAFFLYRNFLGPLAQNLLVFFSKIFRSPNNKLMTSVRLKVKNEFLGPLATQPKKDERPVWIHASSGEIEYAKPIIRKLQESNPKTPILVTYSSISALGFLKNLNDVTYGPAPWDTPRGVSEFMDYWRPKSLLVSRTDLWPEMAFQCWERNIPSLLFSATLNPSSSRLRPPGVWLFRQSLRRISQVACVSEEDQNLLRKRCGNQISSVVTGDTRFDQVSFRLAQTPTPEVSVVKAFIDSRKTPTLIAGSTWPEDEDVLFETLQKKPGWNLVLAPHEIDPTHMKNLEMKLRFFGLSGVKLSESKGPASWTDKRVFVVDKVGILAWLYTLSQVAFVGGSFKKNVHSVMEPMAAGCQILVGTHFQNNREALELQKNGLLNVVTSTEQMQNWLSSFETFSRDKNQNDRSKMLHFCSSRAGASRQVLDWLKNSAKI